MQPSVPEIIDSIEFSLRHELIPELSTPWAKQTGERMLWALEHLRQRANHEHSNAARENSELKALLRFAQAELDGGSQIFESLGDDVLKNLPLESREWPLLDELLAENDLLRSTVDSIVEASPASDVANTDIPLWKEIMQYLVQQTDREQQLAAGDWPPKGS